MRNRMVVVLCALALLAGFRILLPLNAQRPRHQLGENFPPDDNFTVTSDVIYTSGAHGPLKADVYLPRANGPFPGIVFIHGGGWVSGNRNQMIRLIKALAEDGYVGFTIDYDLGKGSFPDALKESLNAVRFFREHAAEYHLDPARIAVAGSSAGGELAALVALAQRDADSRVQAAIVLNGVLDLGSSFDPNSEVTKDVTTYLDGPCASQKETCKAASPQFQVHPGAPPFYVGHGTTDQLVPFEQAVAFTTALKKANVPVEFFKAEGGRHTYWSDPQFYLANLDGMRQFLKMHLVARP